MMVVTRRYRLISARIAAQFGIARDLLGREDLDGRQMIPQMRGPQRGLRGPDSLQRGVEALPGDGPVGEQAVELGSPE